jgi:acetoin:2,6-dichlorophenolindophenol oxidoreductase subunit alpha
MGKTSVTAHDEAYRIMRRIRTFERALLDGFSRGELNGTTHTYIGQEHIAAGYMRVLDPEDVVFSSHRCHGHFIARCGDMFALACELMGKSGAINHGVGGSQHIKYGSFYTNGVQGGIVANGVGAALAEKLTHSNRIVSVFMGDGTLGEGLVYESLNLASLWNAPCVFVLENNQYAQSTPTKTTTAGSIQARFEAFGIRTTATDARSPGAITETARAVVSRVRAGGGPEALVVDTYRLGPHSKSDDTRDEDEMRRYWSLDPLGSCRELLDPAVAETIDADVEAEVSAVLARARNAAPSSWTSE